MPCSKIPRFDGLDDIHYLSESRMFCKRKWAILEGDGLLVTVVIVVFLHPILKNIVYSEERFALANPSKYLIVHSRDKKEYSHVA